MCQYFDLPDTFSLSFFLLQYLPKFLSFLKPAFEIRRHWSGSCQCKIISGNKKENEFCSTVNISSRSVVDSWFPFTLIKYLVNDQSRKTSIHASEHNHFL